MKLGIMQPYFFPYMGYFQLINSVDKFVIYDNIKYTKRGWINRNQILTNGEKKKISLPLKKASDYLNIVDRQLSDTWEKDRKKMLNLIHLSYCKSPFFKNAYGVIEKSLEYNDNNLFNFLLNTIKNINEYLKIDTPMIISSTININHSLKSQDKVLSICESESAKIYINAIGGTSLYSKKPFEERGIKLRFIKTSKGLSIIDNLMSEPVSKIKNDLNQYELERFESEKRTEEKRKKI